MDNSWIHFDSNWREGRGVSQAASAISTIHQLEDLVSSELMASRRNSQIFCWLTQKPEGADENLPSAFGTDTDFENMTDKEIEEASSQEAENATKTISFNKAMENSVVYEALPEGIDAKQLQMQHPNSNVEAMVDWLANRCSATMGLSKIFATGNPQDSNWRANQLFTYPTILEFQKSLEQICDWTFRSWLKWYSRKGLVNSSVLELDLDACVGWDWRGIDDLDEVAHQNAISMKFSNHLTTLKDELGNNWKDTVEQLKIESEYFRSIGMIHPCEALKSGGQSAESEAKVEVQE